MSKNINPPKATKEPKTLENHGHKRVDDYYWLNDREDSKVIDYLNAENDYFDKMTGHTKDFQTDLFEEMKGRIKEDDETVPFKLRGYWYYVRFEEGKDYPIYARKKESLDAEEQLIIDCNEMAKGEDFFNLSGLSISQNNKLVAFGIDNVGRRKYSIHVKNIETGEIFDHKIEMTSGNLTWANDNTTLFYTKIDETTLRSDRVFKHHIDESTEKDELVYKEDDETFNAFVFKTKSDQFVIIGSGSTLSDEYRFIDADKPEDDFKLFQERQRGLEHGITHYGGYFYILTNKDEAQNFKLMKTPVGDTSAEHWEEVIPHREETLLEDVEIFKDYLVINERTKGLNQLRIMSWDGERDYYIPFKSDTYTTGIGNNPDFDSTKLRYAYNSMTTPSSVLEYDMNAQTEKTLKQKEVLDDNFNPENYTSKRIWAQADDGTEVPISIISRKDIERNSKNPLLLSAYGSYGITNDPSFSSIRLSLLDRGFTVAIAHVRGGEYLGRQWYDNGKMLTKRNTFTDFIACSQFLIAEQYTSAEHLYAFGGSAGGMLMGGILNMAPELYNGVIAAVPFVDVVTTMLDDSIPLTTGEYDEWGNPHEKAYYDYMLSYSPYDNVEEKSYPNIMITTGLHDSQVQYWEPAKWIAKLRDYKTDDNLLVMHTNMEAGHGGASGRFEALKEVARNYAFLLDLEGKAG